MSLKSNDMMLEMNDIPQWVTDDRFDNEHERNILLAVHLQDFNHFQKILQLHELNLDSTAVKTCMEICCRRPGYEVFIETLLGAGFNPNALIVKPGITALHLASINAIPTALQVLLSFQRTNVNLISGHGKAAIHYLAENVLENVNHGSVESCTRILLQHSSINVNLCSITDWTLNGNALHLAARNDNHIVLNALLQDGRIDINAVDAYGWTALHYAVRHCRNDLLDLSTSCTHLLLNDPRIDINKRTNQLSFRVTALHLAAAVGNLTVLENLLSDKRTHVRALDSRQRNALHYAAEQSGPRSGVVKRNKSAISTLVHFADIDFNCPDFYEWIALHLAVNRGNFAYVIVMLQEDGGTELCSAEARTWRSSDHKTPDVTDEERIRKCITLLMSHPMIDINEASFMGNKEGVTPLLLAAKSGNYIALEELIKDKSTNVNIIDRENRTVLHYAVEQYGSERAQRCISLLLDGPDKISSSIEVATRFKHDINARDNSGNTALNLAAQRKAQQTVLTLLRHGASIAQRGSHGSPVPHMSPNILQTFLDECIEFNEKSQEDQHFHIKFSYKFLMSSDADSEGYFPESDPLYSIAMCRKMKHLLKHPVLSSFIYLKWRRVRSYFFANIIYHLFFVVLLNTFILKRVDEQNNPSRGFKSNSSNVTHVRDQTGQNQSHTETAGFLEDDPEMLWIILRLLLVGMLFKEVFQLLISPSRYIRNIDNYIELAVIVGTYVNLYSYEIISKKAMPHISTITILLSWMQVVLLTGRLPVLSSQLEMLKKVTWTFVRFFAWYSFIIIAFAMCFYNVFSNRNFSQLRRNLTLVDYFQNPGMSIFKTIIMMAGEFEASTLFFSTAPVTSELVFAVFVFLVAIVMLNLLSGLAVSDTQHIRQQAKVLSLVSRVKLIYYIESMMLGDPLSSCWGAKSLFRFFRHKLPCFRRLHESILLFPHVLQNNIWVVPNEENRVVFSEPLIIADESIQFSYSFERSWFRYLCLDSEIVKFAIDIINAKGSMESDNENKLHRTRREADNTITHVTRQMTIIDKKQVTLRHKIDHVLMLEEKLEKKMEEMESTMRERIQNIEKSLQENKTLLSTILRSLQKQHGASPGYQET
ncbi:transient receptor potential channel pyrexia-like [Periplaneta americana]|uniref:transient receptor potential channel pyrexia-like n=1 Tax=Periplaneta americana TaxID=6978 RepID=UPI0037E8D5B5